SRPPATPRVTTSPAAPIPTTAPSGVARSTRNTFGPAPASYLDIPYSPAATSWAGVSDGVSITMRTDKAAPRVGDLITFDVDLSSSAHVCCGVEVSFGTGTASTAPTLGRAPDLRGTVRSISARRTPTTW